MYFNNTLFNFDYKYNTNDKIITLLLFIILMIGILFKLLNDIYNELKILNNNELIKKHKEVIILNSSSIIENKDYNINPDNKELIKKDDKNDNDDKNDKTDNDDKNYNPIISPSQKNQSNYMIFRKKELLKLKDSDMLYSEKINYIKEIWKKEKETKD